ncbi:MAG TPA: PAS domain-containing protein, partial [Opitutaceae bacterium]
MAAKKYTPLDRVMGRLDTLDPVNMANLVQRLVKERTFYEQIFSTLHEGVIVISSDGVIEYANDSARRLIGLGSDALAGQTLWRLIPGLRPTMEGAESVAAREFELTYPEPRTVRLYMVPFQGDEHRSAVILADVTREKESTA